MIQALLVVCLALHQASSQCTSPRAQLVGPQSVTTRKDVVKEYDWCFNHMQTDDKIKFTMAEGASVCFNDCMNQFLAHGPVFSMAASSKFAVSRGGDISVVNLTMGENAEVQVGHFARWFTNGTVSVSQNAAITLAEGAILENHPQSTFQALENSRFNLGVRAKLELFGNLRIIGSHDGHAVTLGHSSVLRVDAGIRCDVYGKIEIKEYSNEKWNVNHQPETGTCTAI